MDPFLMEKDKDEPSHPNLYRLLKHYIFLFTASIFVSVVGFIIFVILTVEIGSDCQAKTGKQVSVTQFVSYLLQLLFSIAAIHLISKSQTMLYTHTTFGMTFISKIIALVFCIIYRNRNWGECYLSNSQGIMLIVDISLEMVILIALYLFAFNMFKKLQERKLLTLINVANILKA